MGYLDEPQPSYIYGSADYVRIATLHLLAKEILSKQLSGNTAELGVYRGGFARFINQAFPAKKLYLFDTFTGFDGRDLFTEDKQHFSDTRQDFSDTNIEYVLSRMQKPENCLIKQGYFPESAAGLDDSFCFVSLDADLYEPIYAGLNYFYPRLVSGGYIMVHDYNHKLYGGVKAALQKFCSEHKLPYFPIADNSGSVIIGKA